MPINEYLEQTIFEPLKLTNTSFPLPKDCQMPEPFAHGYNKAIYMEKEVDATHFNPSWGDAAGQMISTLPDLKDWTEALGTGKLLSPEIFKERLNWVQPDTATKKYGLGIGFADGWLTHRGEITGYTSIIGYYPPKKVTFVCLVNSDTPVDMNMNVPVTLISNELMKVLNLPAP